MATIGAMVAEARKAARLSQQELADRLGVDQPTVARLEGNKIKRPDPGLLTEVERVLGLSRQELATVLGYLAADTVDYTDEVRRIALIRDPHERAAAIRAEPQELQGVIDRLVEARLTDFLGTTRQ